MLHCGWTIAKTPEDVLEKPSILINYVGVGMSGIDTCRYNIKTIIHGAPGLYSLQVATSAIILTPQSSITDMD